jgi:hypothetical protein
LPCGVESRSVAFGSGSDLSEELAVQDAEPVTLESESFLFCPPGPTWGSVLLAGVGDEVSIDDISEPPLQSPEGFFGGFALGDFAVAKRAAQGFVSELRNRDVPSSFFRLPRWLSR